MPLTEPIANAEIYAHLRVVLGVGLSLSLARLLTGLARFIQHPGRIPIYPVHLGWVAFMILEVLHFWWFEFALGHLHGWTFEKYIFLVAFASLHFLIATVLFPDDLWEYGTFQAYFIARRGWFFGLILAFLACDQVDTILKGRDYYASLGVPYAAKQLTTAAMALAAMRSPREGVQRVTVAVALTLEVLWIAYRHLSL